jgi:ABC-type multidrug transport system permease subunit
MDVANAVVPAFIMVMLFFAGFFVLLNDVTYILRWTAYIDFIRYGFGALEVPSSALMKSSATYCT